MESMYTERNSEYLSKNPNWHAEDSPWKAKQIIKALKRSQIKPDSIAEVGCGVGEILIQLQNQLPQHIKFSGYDIASDALKEAVKKSRKNLDFFEKDIFEDKSFFDLLLVIDVIEHVEDCFSFIRKCREIANYKLFHIPLDVSLMSIFNGGIMRARNSVGHIHYFTKDTALATLKDCGCEIIDWFYTPGAIELPRPSIRTKFARLPRQILYGINKDLAPKVLGGYSLMVLVK
jgi:2-polyprenyl-3-methyl-5-hydroxy-6-metoxy-1,4-benzoquinol methylase